MGFLIGCTPHSKYDLKSFPGNSKGVQEVHLTSSNFFQSYATLGDKVSIRFKANIPKDEITLTMNGLTIPISEVTDGQLEGELPISLAISEGEISFSLDYKDAQNNSHSVSKTSDGKIVIVKTTALPPTGLDLSSPSSSPNLESKPVIKISGVEENAEVTLYSDNCTTKLVSGVSLGTEISLATTELTTGEHTFFADQIDFLGNRSACSSASVKYERIKQPFISTWLTTSSNETITLPLVYNYNYDMKVNWGDGTPVQEIKIYNDPNRSHIYKDPGSYIVTIYGICEAWSFASLTISRDKIISITNLGDVGWKNLNGAFKYASNITTVSGGNTSEVTDMSSMFQFAPLAIPDTSSWDTSNVTDMSFLFEDNKSNPDVSNWKTDKVTSFEGMFKNTSIATPNTSNWKTDKAKSMANMFSYASLANPDTSNWNTGEVTTMAYMFNNAPMAEPDTSRWDTRKVTQMNYLFGRARKAKPETYFWNTRNVTDMSSMFESADVATPDTSGPDWSMSKVTSISNMFRFALEANPDTSKWDTSSIFYMNDAFAYTRKANPNVEDWNVSNVINMSSLFNGTMMTTPSLVKWDTRNVKDMSNMFTNTLLANPDLDNWDVTNVTNFNGMFYGAKTASPKLSLWNFAGATTLHHFFELMQIPTSEYDNLLIQIELTSPKSGLSLGGGNSKFSDKGKVARDKLIARGWIITDGGHE